MSKLTIIDSGILYINPDPAHYHVFASHAHPVQLATHEFLATASLTHIRWARLRVAS